MDSGEDLASERESEEFHKYVKKMAKKLKKGKIS
jgi:hypothetical protein